MCLSPVVCLLAQLELKFVTVEVKGGRDVWEPLGCDLWEVWCWLEYEQHAIAEISFLDLSSDCNQN